MHMPHIHVRHMHMPNAHQMAVKINHMIHDSRFWAVVALVVITLLIILTAILSSSSGARPLDRIPGPAFPFLY